MLLSKYKTILDNMPVGVFAFDKRARIEYSNPSFMRTFPAFTKGKGELKGVLSCKEKNACGKNPACEFCALFSVMNRAIHSGKEENAVASFTIPFQGRTDTVTVRVRVFPADAKGKLFFGIADGTYGTEMAREMLSAKRMQQRLLPVGKSAGGIPYSFLYLPCLDVGGDMPEVYENGDETFGVLSDVSGKGVSAGMLSAFVKAGWDKNEPSLSRAVENLNAKFSSLNLDERSYVTLAGVRISEKEKLIRYILAGHNAPILLKTPDGINEIESPAPPVSGWMPDFKYSEKEFPFGKGDILVLLSDGVTECANRSGDMFGIERAESVLHQSRTAEEFIANLKNALAVFCGGKFSDDVTAIAFDL